MTARIVISGDSHVVEPFDLWKNTLGDKYGERAPQTVKDYQGVPGTFFFSGCEYIKVDEIVETVSGHLVKAVQCAIAGLNAARLY